MDYTGDGKHNIDITENAKPFFGFEGRKIGINKTNTYKKEVKKVNRPYFETKVVKVKKIEKPIVSSKEWTPDYCPCCGQRTVEEKKGNWVNGENLDAIKYPCLCRFDARKGIYPHSNAVHGIGMINKTFTEEQVEYQLSWADRQSKDLSVLCSTPSLKKLMEIYDIEIRKGKIIIFEEEK